MQKEEKTCYFISVTSQLLFHIFCFKPVLGTNCEFGPCETYETDFDGETFCENDGQCLNVIVMEGDVSTICIQIS